MQTIPIIDISRRPKANEPCNQCGYCCSIAVCPPGATLVYGMPYTLHGRVIDEPCKALVPLGDQKYGCGLIVNPDQWIHNGQSAESNSEAIKILISSGMGCNSYTHRNNKHAKKMYNKYSRKCDSVITPKIFSKAWLHIFPEFEHQRMRELAKDE